MKDEGLPLLSPAVGAAMGKWPLQGLPPLAGLTAKEALKAMSKQLDLEALRQKLEHDDGLSPHHWQDFQRLMTEAGRLLDEKLLAIEALQLAKDVILDAMHRHNIYPSLGNFVYIEEALNKLKGSSERPKEPEAPTVYTHTCSPEVCRTDGGKHTWDGPTLAMGYGDSVTCSKCGISAMEVDQWVAP